MNENKTPSDDVERTTETESRASKPLSRVDAYRILQKIGEGGMGEVYLAEQEKPVRRRVALKIIKRGMDTAQVIARFAAERQALAMMNHANVAKVLDAGSTERGRPYFVMEYVEGVPITEYCDRQRLTMPERLELFTEVCEGVEHAHQKAIIHRDIKPSNVLVATHDGRRIPKIIDFGVAKATAQRLTERTIYTELGQLIGTPEYMSPEQAEMTPDAVDTRTDVYALGVLLYVLLVGALPFDSKELRSAGFDGIRRKIREDEPPRPSARLDTLGDQTTESARRRKTDPLTLQRQLEDDLDWITMRALEKDRTRRYASPRELAADIRRHLANEPVLAGPPSTIYRAKKFLRRHRLGVALASAVLLSLLVGIAGTTTGLVRARRAESETSRQAQTAERITEVLVGMIGDVDAARMGKLLMEELRTRAAEAGRADGASASEIAGRLENLDNAVRGVNTADLALRLLDEELLARSVPTIEAELAEEPLIAGRLNETIAETYSRLGLLPQGVQHARAAVEIRVEELGPDHPETILSMKELGWLYYRQGQLDEAEEIFLEAIHRARRALGEDHPAMLMSRNNLSLVYVGRNRLEEAEAIERDVFARWRRLKGEEHQETLVAANNLAWIHERRGHYAEAESLHRENLEIQRRMLEVEHPDILLGMQNVAWVMKEQERFEEAGALYEELLEIRRRKQGNDHFQTMGIVGNLAWVYQALGRHDEAEAMLQPVIRRRIAQGKSPWRYKFILAVVHQAQERYDEAEPVMREYVERMIRQNGENNPNTTFSMYHLGALLRDQRRYEAAAELWKKTLEIQRQALGDDHPQTLQTAEALAWLGSEPVERSGAH
jgi:non-specific serine/threonine protein kinase/serine/threonine-protein kinase